MGAIAEAFRNGGIWMYLILAGCLPLGVLTLGVLLGFYPAVAKGKGRKLFGGAAVLLLITAIGVALTGLAGYYVGLNEVEAALQHASPENAARMRAMGEDIAGNALTFGVGAAAAPFLLAVAALTGLVISKPATR